MPYNCGMICPLFGDSMSAIDSKLSRMRVGAAVVGGLGLVGSVVGASGAESAANTQATAADHATDVANATQLQMYNQTRDDQAPYRQAGYGALSSIGQQLQSGTGFAQALPTSQPFTQNDFTSDPGYQFSLQQGTQGAQRSAAAGGSLMSGGTLKALDQYSTGLASQTYGDAYNRYLATNNQIFSQALSGRQLQYNQLASLAGLGQTSLGQTGAAGTSAANGIASTSYNGITAAGAASAAGTVGVSNAINSGLTSVGSAYGQSQALKTFQSGTSYGLPPGYSPASTNNPGYETDDLSSYGVDG